MFSTRVNTPSNVSFVSEHDDGSEDYFTVAEKEVRRELIENPKKFSAHKYGRKIIGKNARLQSDESEQTAADAGFFEHMKMMNIFAEMTKGKKGEEIDEMVKQNFSYLLKLIEDCFVTYQLMSRYAKTLDDVRLVLFNFLKLRIGDRLGIQFIQQQIDGFIAYLFESPEQPEMQSAETVEFTLKSIRACLGKYDEIKNCAAFQKIYKLLMFGLAHSLFDKFGVTMDKLRYTKVEQEAMKQKYWLGPDLIYCLIDTTLFLCERGLQCYKMGSLDPIFHSSDKYAEFFDKCLVIKKQSKQLNMPEEYGFTLSDYLNDLENAIETARAIHKHAGIVGDYEKKFTRNMLNDLEMLKFEFQMRKEARKMRETPFALLLYGDSSIGKSSLIKILTTVFARINGLNPSDEFVYTKNPAAKYYDGFSSFMHTLIIDDAGYLKPSAANGVDPTLADVILAINPVSWCPDQASIEDKGRNPFMGKLVIASTNTEDLNSFHYFACPSAVQRRFPYILDISVKDEYRSSEGTLDSTKVPELNEGELPDYWNFTIKIIEPQSVRVQKRSIAKTKIIARNLSMPDLMVWYRDAIRKHNANQGKMSSAFKKVEAINMCEACQLPSYICECDSSSETSVELQTMETVMYTSVTAYMFLLIAQILSSFFCKWLFFRKLTVWRNDMWRRYTFFTTPMLTNGTRDQWSKLGLQVCEKIGYPKLALIFCTILSSGLVISKTLNFLKFDSVIGEKQESSAVLPKEVVADIPEREILKGSLPEGRRPIVENPEPENVWVKDDYVLSAFDVAPKSIGAKNMSKEHIIKTISDNCVFLKMTIDCGTHYVSRTQRALCIMGRQYLVNSHFFKDMTDYVELYVASDLNKDGVTTNIKFLLNKSEITFVPGTDLCLFSIPILPAKKNIFDFIAKSSYRACFDGTYVLRNENGEVTQNPLRKLRLTKMAHPEESNVYFDVWEGTPERVTVNGDCGSALVCFTHFGPVIVGIHIAKTENAAIAHCINQELLKPYMKLALQSSVPQLSAKGYEHHIGPLRPNAHVRFIHDGVGEVYGTMPMSRRRSRSMVMTSPFAPFLQPHGYEVRYGAPVMNGWRPWAKAIEPLAGKDFSFKNDIVIELKKVLTNHLLKNLTKDDLSEVMQYDLFTAVNGVPGLKFIDKMPRNTSMGHPWNKSKKYFLTAIPPQHGVNDPVEFDAEVVERANQIILNYIDGNLNHPVFTAHLKDEARSFSKIESAATRVFSGAPVDFSIVVRMYYLSIVRLIQKNKFLFMSAPGVNATSWEWHDMYTYLTHFGKDRMVAGDYKNFDKNMESSWIMWAFEILMEIGSAAGMSPEQLLVMHGIAEDTAYALTNFNGDIVRFYRGNPSGHPLTVIINCIVNIGYLMYCYHELNPLHEAESFFDNVHLLTYGDDNIFGVSRRCDWFNHTAISQVLASVNIVYTMADKTSESVPFIDISECTFLKRNWRMHELGYMVGQLEEDSIEKMLMVWVKSKTLDTPQQGMAIIASATREYFLYGREIFEAKKALLRKVVSQLDWDMYIESYTFPNFDDLVENFYHASSVICTQTFGVIPNFKQLMRTN